MSSDAQKSLAVGIVGATGAVGQEMMRVLERRHFPLRDLRAFASSRSEGIEVRCAGRSTRCLSLKPGCFKDLDIIFFDASDAVSLEWVPEALRAGAWVVDNSATFRMDSKTPLIVPEINHELIASLTDRRLVAGPNCSTVQLVLPLHALSRRWGLKRVVVTTMQSVSGAGTLAIEELKEQTKQFLNHGKSEELKPNVFLHPIAFNCIPQIGKVGQSLYTSEEQKIIDETRKILSLPDLAITATAVRVPTLRGHAESVNVELLNPADLSEVSAVLSDHPGIRVLDDPVHMRFAMNMDAAHSDAVFVSRIRPDHSTTNGFQFWIVSDNLLKGAALNAVQIGEIIHSKMSHV